MSAESGAPSPRGRRHGRNASHNKVSLPMKSARNPLEVSEDPLAPPPMPPRPAASEKQPLSPEAKPVLTEPEKDFSFLLKPENFHPLSSDDLLPSFQRQYSSSTPIRELLRAGNFRHAAIHAATLLTRDPPPPQEEIFSLLYTRLACLTLLNLLPLAAQESRVLQDLTSPFYLTAGPNRKHILPWELRVLAIRLQAIAVGDTRRSIAGYYDLARDARSSLSALCKPDASSEILTAEEDVEELKALWQQRLSDLSIRVANALIEMGDFSAAARHLEDLRSKSLGRKGSFKVDEEQQELATARLALVYLRIGNLASARKLILGSDEVNADSTIKTTDEVTAAASSTGTLAKSRGYLAALQPVLALAEGNPARAATLVTSPNAPSSVSSSTTITPATFAKTSAAQAYPTIASSTVAGLDAIGQINLAVAALYAGEMGQARALLEGMLEGDGRDEKVKGEAFPVALFNLATVYELCAEKPKDLKMRLAERAAALEGSEERGWERGIVEFKL